MKSLAFNSILYTLCTCIISCSLDSQPKQYDFHINKFKSQLAKHNLKLEIETKQKLDQSIYTLEEIPATIVLVAKVYKNNKLCYQDSLQQKFYIPKIAPTMHSQQWQSQYQAITPNLAPIIKTAIKKC